MEEYSVNYPVVYGTNEVVIDYGYIQAIPTTFIIDEEGNVADSFLGLIPKVELEKKIKSVLKGS
jgi:peroxiredoxin